MKPISFLLRKYKHINIKIQIISLLVLNSYFTQKITKGICIPVLNCHACPLASFSCPIGALQYFAARLKSFPFYVIGILVFVGSCLGRITCGWICPFGMIQDIVFKTNTINYQIPKSLQSLKYFVLVSFVIIIPILSMKLWFCKLCPAGGLLAAIPNIVLNAEMRSTIGKLFWIKISILIVFVFSFLFFKRPFCRVFCPLGAILGIFNKISFLKLTVDNEKCNHCGKCKKICPVDIKVYADPNSSECIRCLRCVKSCDFVSIKLIK